MFENNKLSELLKELNEQESMKSSDAVSQYSKEKENCDEEWRKNIAHDAITPTFVYEDWLTG